VKHGFTVNWILLLLKTIDEFSDIIHPNFKFFDINTSEVSIVNTTVAVKPEPE